MTTIILVRGEAVSEHSTFETRPMYHNGKKAPQAPATVILSTHGLLIANRALYSTIFGSGGMDIPRGNPLMVYQCTKPEGDARDLRSGFLTGMEPRCPRREAVRLRRRRGH